MAEKIFQEQVKKKKSNQHTRAPGCVLQEPAGGPSTVKVHGVLEVSSVLLSCYGIDCVCCVTAREVCKVTGACFAFISRLGTVDGSAGSPKCSKATLVKFFFFFNLLMR